MNIGTAAQRSNLPAKTIRYYEDIGLVRPGRASNGYREYSDQDVHLLSFVQRARSLGFSVEECRLLLSLYEDQKRASADVKHLAEAKIAEIDSKIDQLQSLRNTLTSLALACRGDGHPDCPIMDDLGSGPAPL